MSDNLGSKEKILVSACKLFAQKGLKQTTVRDICADSDSYQISINYYFGSKENLFKEAVMKCFEFTKVMDYVAALEGLPPEEQLYQIFKRRVELSFFKDERSWYFDILSKEFNTHIELMNSLLPETLTRFLDALKVVLLNINPEANDFDIDYCCFLFMSEALSLVLNTPTKQQLLSSGEPSQEDIERIARAMTFNMIQGLKNSNKGKF